MNDPRHRSPTWLIRVLAGSAASVLALGWFFAVPSSADNVVVVDQPSDGQRLEKSNVTISGHVETALLTNVDSIRVEVTRLRDARLVVDALLCAPCGQDAKVPFSYTTPSLDQNGPYALRVRSTGYLLVNGLKVNDAVAERAFTIVVRPAAPTNLRAETLPDNTVKLTWGAVPPYPDLIGYLVYRGAPGAELKPLRSTSPGVTSHVDADPAAGGGSFQYRVAAVRDGAVPGDSSQWLLSESNLATVTVPAPATSISLSPDPAGGDQGTNTTTLAAGASLDLGSFFGSAAANSVNLPAPSSPQSIQLPDTGFNPSLPFSNTTIGLTPPPAQGARPATTVPKRPNSAISDREDIESNRRALLVPVAAGSVLCVAALHLRWLSLRLAVPPLDGAGGDLEVTEADLDEVLEFEPVREPVGAGK